MGGPHAESPQRPPLGVLVDDQEIAQRVAGVLARWGLSWDVLRPWNPRLIYASFTTIPSCGQWRRGVALPLVKPRRKIKRLAAT